MRPRDYSVHGLGIRVYGNLPLPLTPGSVGFPDVHVRAGVPPWADAPLDPARILRAGTTAGANAALIDAGWVTGGDGLRLRFAEGATFWISREFDDVCLAYEPPLTPADAAHFLLEPVLAFMLRHRGTLVLHASAVALDGRAVAFCGTAGAGKSTWAAACVRAGWRLISDDVVALRALEDGDPRWIAHRGTPAIRLWDDGAAALLGDAGRAPLFSETWAKRVVSVQALGGRHGDDRTPLRAVIVLAPGDRAAGHAQPEPRITALTGHAAVGALLAHTVAGALHDQASRARELAQLGRLAADLPVVGLSGRPSLSRLPSIVAGICGSGVA